MRLLIGDVVERDDHPVIKKTSLVRVPIRLGADVFDSGIISAAKRNQLIKALKAFRLLTEVHGAHYLRCCATSAMREATNSAEVLARVEKESGIRIELIDGRMEADLSSGPLRETTEGTGDRWGDLVPSRSSAGDLACFSENERSPGVVPGLRVVFEC